MQLHPPRPCVLFVDDDVYQAQAYIDALRDNGFDVVSCQSASDALHLAASQTFDAFILDVMMPPGDAFDAREVAGGFRTGLAIARRLVELAPTTKVAALSTSADAEVVDWFESRGLYIDKRQTHPSRLPRLVRRILDEQSPPRVFIVHGRDHGPLRELKDFLRLEFRVEDPIVLAEERHGGLTIIEKLERFGRDVDVVFVLLTPDDVGYFHEAPQQVAFRPRMNVVFEFGYFLATLRRCSGKLILLTKGEIELPSDISGLATIDIEGGILSAANLIKSEMGAWRFGA